MLHQIKVNALLTAAGGAEDPICEAEGARRTPASFEPLSFAGTQNAEREGSREKQQ